MNETPRPSFSLRDIIAQIRRRIPWLPGKPPTVRPDPVDTEAELLRIQVRVIRKAFERAYGKDSVAVAGSEGPRRARDDADAVYLYRPGHMLVRVADYELLDRFFRDPEREGDFTGELVRVSEPTPGVLLTRVPSRKDRADDVLASLEELDKAHPERVERRDPVATPDHILYVTATGKMCPATEPEEPPSTEPVPPPTSEADAGSGVRVSVVDTGLWVQATTSSDTDWLAGVTPADPQDVENVNSAAIHEYAGHGTFVAGIIRCLAPKTEIEVEGALPDGGAVYESRLCEELQEALGDRSDPQLVSISAGTHTRGSFNLIGFQILAENLGLTDGTKGLVVAAAGNDKTDDPFYPAAFPWVVGVGALDERGNVADYSNFGPWVDVWARGSNLVNAFPEGRYTCYEPPNTGQVRNFKFLARWSGTSFATPIVTGAIAAQMSATGNLDDPKKAFDQLDQSAPTCQDPKAGGGKHVGPL